MKSKGNYEQATEFGLSLFGGAFRLTTPCRRTRRTLAELAGGLHPGTAMSEH